MVLNDIIHDVKFIRDKLSSAARYISKCQEIYQLYYDSHATASATYYSSALNDACRNSYIAKLSSIVTQCFNASTELNALAFDFYAIINELTKKTYCVDILTNDVEDFANASKQVIRATNSIIMTQLEKSRSQNLIPLYISDIQNLLHTHRKLSYQCEILFKIEPVLWEPLPEIETRTDLVHFELRSYNNTSNLSGCAHDLQLLDRFMTQLSTFEAFSTPIYTRKIESGSLNVTWSGGQVELTCISDIINALVDGIRNLAFLPTDIQLKKQTVEKAKLENESLAIENTSKKLAVINSQIDIIANRLNIDKDNPTDKEKLEQLCVPLVEYLENNPLGSINGSDYDLKSSIKYLTCKE